MQLSTNRLLLIEPIAALETIYRGHLEQAGYTVDLCHSVEHAHQTLAETDYALVLIDCQITQSGVQSIMALLRDQKKSSAVVLLASQQDQSFLPYLLRKGAKDYLIKPISDLRLLTSVRNLMDQAKMHSMLKRLDEESEITGLHGLVGSSVAMQTVYKTIRNVASSDSPVYIRGEEGTDKASCAAAIHAASPRAHHAFAAVDCATVESGKELDTILFGSGSVSEASSNSGMAVLRQVSGGTLFLNNIGDMPIKVQHKLLAFIQTGHLHGAGLSSAEKNMNVRLIAGTATSLKSQVWRGSFIEELYTHLSMLPLSLPPLRDRDEDVVMLANKYLKDMADDAGTAPLALTPSMINKLKEHSWPGNVNELHNWLLSLTTQSAAKGRTVVPPFRAQAADHYMNSNVVSIHLPQTALKEEVSTNSCKLEEFERWIIESRIKAKGGSIPKAADSLGISPSTIYRKRESWVKNLDMADSNTNSDSAVNE